MTEPYDLNEKIGALRNKLEMCGFELIKEEEERLRKCYKVWWNMPAEELITTRVRKRGKTTC